MLRYRVPSLDRTAASPTRRPRSPWGGGAKFDGEGMDMV
jgi:hypothetical protein